MKEEMKEIRVINPYERLKEIDEKVALLEKEELSLKEFIKRKIDKNSNQKRLDDVESEELFLIIEQNSLKLAVDWFEIYIQGFNRGKDINDKKFVPKEKGQ